MDKHLSYVKNKLRLLLFFLNLKKIPGLVRVYGYYPNLKYISEYNIQAFESRNLATIRMLKKMFERYKKDIKNGEYFNIYIYTGDRADEAELFRKKLNLKKIYAYSTMKKYYNKVIPIPDYMFDSWKESGMGSYKGLIKECQLEGDKNYIDERCFWIGSVKTHYTRNILIKLSEKYSNIILAIGMHWLSNETGKKQKTDKFVSLPEHAKYKYLIDIQGYGWSGRLKVLFWLKRPVFIVNRVHEEFYFKYLIDYKNCIFVKEDLSDLIDKIRTIEKDKDLYNNLSLEAQLFAKKYLNENAVIKYLYEIIKENEHV